jgi:hypothetical protein
LNKPSPAIIAQSAVRRLPRLVLLLFCAAYVLPGFFGREPWKNEDIASFGVMRDLATGASNWLSPQLLGKGSGIDALLPYWIGAIGIKLLPFLDSALAARIPFIALMFFTLTGTWYATYYLARSPQAQPVAFAFGGEAEPIDYARAIADAGLLALIACLGLAQLSHETTPAAAQLGFAALTFYALAASPYRRATAAFGPALGLVAGLAGLALSGAPAIAMLLGLGGLVAEWTHRVWGNTLTRDTASSPTNGNGEKHSLHWMVLILAATVLAGLLASLLDLWRWRIQLPGSGGTSAWADWRRLGRLLLWFTWPSWPLALWTVWRWRRQLASRHVALPLWCSGVCILAALLAPSADRTLLLGLPPLAALAAFALPTLKRSVASLIDWFTLVFFTGCSVIVWVVWIAMQTGTPRQPAANVAKLAPGFEPTFSFFAFLIALAATISWAWLVQWRVGANRAAIWKSLVLPAGGATLCWILLMTLWLPLLDFARSYAAMSRQVASRVERSSCVEILGISNAQAAALKYHGGLELRQSSRDETCPFLIVDSDVQASMSQAIHLPDWALMATLSRPTDKTENILLFKRVGIPQPSTRLP